jgi:hypothetical protein
VTLLEFWCATNLPVSQPLPGIVHYDATSSTLFFTHRDFGLVTLPHRHHVYILSILASFMVISSVSFVIVSPVPDCVLSLAPRPDPYVFHSLSRARRIP